MAPLPESLRRQLEKTVVDAREVAEMGAREALLRLAVDRPEAFTEMSVGGRELRVRLRAHARQLGDPRKATGEQSVERLVTECAYEHWHRMLFARFLAESNLLIHPDHGVPVTLQECEELARSEAASDRWDLAGRFAARMLPGIFRPHDATLAVSLAPEHTQALEALLESLVPETFTADDSLGWVYQFWQAKRKEEVNDSGAKIGAEELPSVTQLFTEPYMVQFLLHNTLGAWWAGKILTERPELALTAADEDELRRACELPECPWPFLRFVREQPDGRWRPAAGQFDEWPRRAAELTVMDPCCGSGHFLVEAFRILVPLRMEEERLSASDATNAVLRQNIFGLELDERCTQIAAFNLALAAWSYPRADGHRPLPELHLACSGLAVGASRADWERLADGDQNVRLALGWLHDEFRQAPVLGSLIDPARGHAAKLVEWSALAPLLERALAHEALRQDAQASEAAVAAQGLARAAALLTMSYTLVMTNVPYLGRGKQDVVLKSHLEAYFPTGKADLATAFVLRCLSLCTEGGSVALVTPQNWLFLPSYSKLRENLLKRDTWNAVIRLGSGAFGTIGGQVVNVAMLVLSTTHRKAGASFLSVDVSDAARPNDKAACLRGALDTLLTLLFQEEIERNPDFVVTGQDLRGELLNAVATATQGLKTGDDDRYRREFWEVSALRPSWRFLQSTITASTPYGGRSSIIDWSTKGTGMARLQGMHAWGRTGVAVKLMGQIPATIYTGDIFDSNVAPIVPADPSDLPALWCFCESGSFAAALRRINTKLSIAEGSVTKVPFDLGHWRAVAQERYPDGLPAPETDDPTQWLFHGYPVLATTRLQVAVARLLGYQWPAESDDDIHLSTHARALARASATLSKLADSDGVVCIPAVLREQPAADQLRRLLDATAGRAGLPGAAASDATSIGSTSLTLENWLRDYFFEEHCQLFHQRPFIWHIWDGRRRDGFAALVNYHKLDRKLLERLTFTILGDWITQQRSAANAGTDGAEDRLASAEALQAKLALILEGGSPFDVFVRWKPLHDQAIGWEPDLNDGVRMNIRPFVEAGVLRKNPKLKWTKDRGSECEDLSPRDEFPWLWTDGVFAGERVNDVHLDNPTKRAARERRERGRRR